MSITAVGWVLESSTSRGAARAVEVVLAWHANGRGECWPAQRTIAREANLSHSSVQSALAALVDNYGWRVLKSGGPRRSTLYAGPDAMYRLPVHRGPIQRGYVPATGTELLEPSTNLGGPLSTGARGAGAGLLPEVVDAMERGRQDPGRWFPGIDGFPGREPSRATSARVPRYVRRCRACFELEVDCLCDVGAAYIGNRNLGRLEVVPPADDEVELAQ